MAEAGKYCPKIVIHFWQSNFALRVQRRLGEIQDFVARPCLKLAYLVDIRKYQEIPDN
jgi:hypothetical protein